MLRWSWDILRSVSWRHQRPYSKSKSHGSLCRRRSLPVGCPHQPKREPQPSCPQRLEKLLVWTGTPLSGMIRGHCCSPEKQIQLEFIKITIYSVKHCALFVQTGGGRVGVSRRRGDRWTNKQRYSDLMEQTAAWSSERSHYTFALPM